MTLNLASWFKSWWNKHKLCVTYTDYINHFEHQTSFQFVFCTQLLTSTHQTPTGGGRFQKPSFKERIKLNIGILRWVAWGYKHLLWEGQGYGYFLEHHKFIQVNNVTCLGVGIQERFIQGASAPTSKPFPYYTFHRGNGTPFTYQQYKHSIFFHWVCSRYFEKPF